MSIPLRPLAGTTAAVPGDGQHRLAPPPSDQALLKALLRDGVIAPHHLPAALTLQPDRRSRLPDLMLSRRLVEERPLYDALARYWQLGHADLSLTFADPRLINRFGALNCLKEGLLPWRSVGGQTVVVASHPDIVQRNRSRLAEVFGPLIFSVAPARQIEAALLAASGPGLARRAETRVALEESCRRFPRLTSARAALVLLLTLALITALSSTIRTALTIWAVVTLVLAMGLKFAALIASLRPDPANTLPPPVIARLPTVSIIVALYRESEIAGRLIRRLGRLDYPKELLDIVLVVEEDDAMTRAALARADLPGWMRVVTAPEGRVKTKPRALNFALDHCRGSIVGVYDAEDAPEPDQIRKVVERFHCRGAEVACLQGALDFYNPETNWLSRCFTIEYASWFRVMLPGLQRLGLPIPLGGTTLFFRRTALEKLGGWDAWNVTEDADLGLRLVRHGLRTEIIGTTTFEEANCRTIPWVKQRSRWIKGYMMTYLTHMRRPLLLWRQIGAWRFLGFQILFLGSLSQALLGPVLWSYWALALVPGHPAAGALSGELMPWVMGLFLAAELCNITLGLFGLKRSGHKLNAVWVVSMNLYFPLQAFAAYKALWELLHRPFYWDKTSHGLFDGAA